MTPSSATQIALPRNETELRHAIIRMCDAYGLLWHWCGDSRRCNGKRGLPDLIICGHNGLLFAELKGPDGTTSAEQDLWLWHLNRGPSVLVRTWRPKDWADGTIRALLESIR